MKEAIAILTGGGPAPGMNTVVGSVAKTFLRQGYRVIGLHEGYTGLFNPSPRTVDIDYPMADGIFNQGGSFLQMSRFKPKDSDFENNFNLKFFTDNNVKLLVTVGGDDTASTANRIAKFLEAKKYPIANIHVPKTIDNDLPLPKGTPTFGYESAKDKGAVIARAVYVDARTSGNWFVLAAMGRSAGHLAFGIGEACHYPMIVIPEMFDKTEITVEKIVNLVISSIIKRKIMGMDYGAAVISEGVFHALSDEEIRKSGIHFTYDEHGHPELGKVSKAHIFNEMIEMKLKELGLKVKSRPVELGYEIRCQTPIAYDLTYCSELGIGVHKLFAEGKTGCMVYVDSEGNVSPLYLKDLQDPTTGKIPPRLVDIKSDKFTSVVETILNAITPADYEAAKAYVPNPEEYDFHKILIPAHRGRGFFSQNICSGGGFRIFASQNNPIHHGKDRKTGVRADARNTCGAGIHGLRIRRTAGGIARRSEKEHPRRTAVVRRRTGFQFHLLLFHRSRRPLRHRHGSHPLGCLAGNHGIIRLAENQAWSRRIRRLLAHACNSRLHRPAHRIPHGALHAAGGRRRRAAAARHRTDL